MSTDNFSRFVYSIVVLTAVVLLFKIEDWLFKPKDGVGSGEGKKVITIAVYPSLDKAYAELIPLFESENPGIRVQLRTLGYADHHNMLITTIAAGDGAPDIAAIETDYVGQLMGGGGFEDLSQPPYNATQYKDSFASYKWSQATSGAGKLYALPVDISPACIFYRKDVFDRFNIEISDIQTMEDVYKLGEKVSLDTDGDGRQDQWLVPGADYIFKMIFYSSEKRFLTDNGEANLKSEQIKKAIYWSNKIRNSGMSANVKDWTNEWYSLIKEGKVVYFPMGSWLAAHLKEWIAADQVNNFRVAPLPALEPGMDRMNANWGGSFLGIVKDSEHKAEAWKFIEFITTREQSQLTTFKKADALPSLKSAWNNELFKVKDDYFGGQEVRKLWISSAKKIPNVKISEVDNIALSILMSSLTDILNETKTTDEALDTAQKELNNRLRVL